MKFVYDELHKLLICNFVSDLFATVETSLASFPDEFSNICLLLPFPNFPFIRLEMSGSRSVPNALRFSVKVEIVFYTHFVHKKI